MDSPGLAVIVAVVLPVVGVVPGGALETDQYYSWGRSLEDSTGVLNARINLALEDLVAELNREQQKGLDCQRVRVRFFRNQRMLFFNGFETWAVNSPLVSRSPAGPEEQAEFRASYMYRTMSILDTGSWMPPSPTVLAAGVRFGTDKLTHMLGTGWYYHRWYRRALARGASPDRAEWRALRKGLRVENTVLGKLVSGVLSFGDLEANHQGMLFYEDLCAGDDPTLVQSEDGRWRIARPFDLADHVTPEWDESYHPNVYTRRKWAKVQPVLLGYCRMLDHPEVREMRRIYAERDMVTLTERLVEEMVAQGRIPDPSRFSIEAACGADAAG